MDEWLLESIPWSIEVLGLLTEERRLRAMEHDCLARLRAVGTIR